jgi:hypothetical protein
MQSSPYVSQRGRIVPGMSQFPGNPLRSTKGIGREELPLRRPSFSETTQAQHLFISSA